jgi:TolB protein
LGSILGWSCRSVSQDASPTPETGSPPSSATNGFAHPDGGPGIDAAGSGGAGTDAAAGAQSTPVTSGPVPIQYGGSLQNPCFSPDGQSLVFTSFNKAYNTGTAVVGVVSIAGGTPTLVSPTGAQSVNIPGSCWNGATNRIAFSSDVVDHDEVYLVSPDGTGRTRVTHRSALAWEPSLSPDGQWIVFESHPLNSDANGSIWKIQTDGTGLTQLTDGSGNDKEPNWAPVGGRILFQSPRNGNIDLFTIDTDGNDLKQVTTSPADDTDASWSPDGQRIVYSSDQGTLKYAGVYVIPSAGGTPKRVTMEDAYCGAPSWSPDGKWIAYETTPGDPDTSSGATIRIVAAP